MKPKAAKAQNKRNQERAELFKQIREEPGLLDRWDEMIEDRFRVMSEKLHPEDVEMVRLNRIRALGKDLIRRAREKALAMK